jgi:hypothetical protein
VSDRVRELDWEHLSQGLDASGNAVVERLLTEAECRSLAALYADAGRFRSRVVMGRHGFGQGEYQYFGYPLPEIVSGLRAAFYPQLAPIANRWNDQMRIDSVYPATHAEFLSRCREAGQDRPTPLQVAILLSQPGTDFGGGEFVMTEQRPRMQSRPEVVPLRQGDAVIFAVSHRPVQGTRGIYRVNLRHGVSRVRRGKRHTLGVIFHDAK